ncbi:MAG TPA: peptide deformylase [Candidatus Saccharimonadales bacterium]|nr:peptide deformylase [Candidatus Saccharimonadales bacterium]
MNTWKPVMPSFSSYKKDVFQKAGEVGEFIYQIGELPSLRNPSKVVPIETITTKEYQVKFTYLKQCLQKYRELTGKGRGIAAIQIGIPECFAVIYHPEKSFIIINPKVTVKSEKKLIYPEICMSEYPIIASVVRPAWIEFTYYDEEGEMHEWKEKDATKQGRIMNRVFQHEIDHMDGIINIDICNSKDLILESDPTYYNAAKFEEI